MIAATGKPKSGWMECKLGDVVVFQRGHDLPKTEMNAGMFPVAGSNGIIGHHNEATTKGPGITIGRSGNIGTPKFYKDDFWAHNTVLYVKDFRGNDEKFVFYFLHTFDFSGFNAGSAVPTLNRNHIHEIPVAIPPLPTQRSIAAVLSSLDDKIDLLHRQNKTLEGMASALWRKMFIEEASEDWEKTSVGEAISVKGGTTPNSNNPDFWNGDVPWTSPRDLSSHDSVYMFDTSRKITQAGLAQIGSGLLPTGSVLLSSRAPIGYMVITDIEVAINQGYVGIICDKGVSNYYMFIWIRHNMDTIIGAANGSTFLEISKSVFKELEFILPSKKALDSYNYQVSPLFSKIRNNQLQIRSISKLRDTLLPKLMSGEVRARS